MNLNGERTSSVTRHPLWQDLHGGGALTTALLAGLRLRLALMGTVFFGLELACLAVVLAGPRQALMGTMLLGLELALLAVT